MDNNVLTPADLVQQALENNPSKMGSTFNDLIMSKIVDAVATKKQELQQTMFNYAETDQDDNEEEADSDIEKKDELEQQDGNEDSDEQNLESDA